MPIPSPEQVKAADPQEQARKEAQETMRKRQEKEKTRQEVTSVINAEEVDLLDRYRSEIMRASIKVIEQKTGQSLEFSAEQYASMQKYVEERYAMLMTSRAEEYLHDHADEVKDRFNPEAKGTVALDTVERLGVVKKIIEGDEELKKVYTAFAALKEFSRGDIPPSARFAVMEQLNALQDLQKDSDELRRTRIEVFKKWSGHEAPIDASALTLKVEGKLRKETRQYLKEITDALSLKDREFSSQSGLALEDCAMLRDLGYTLHADIPNALLGLVRNRRFEVTKDGVRRDASDIASDMTSIRREWRTKVKEEKEGTIKEKIKLEMDGAFVAGVTSKTPDELNAIYDSLETDIHTEFDRKGFMRTEEGKQTIIESREAIQDKGSIGEFMRSAETKFDSLSHDLETDKTGLIQDIRDRWGIDIDSDTFTRFQEATALDYNTFSKKRMGTVFYLMKLIAFAAQEIKKAKVVI